MGNDQNKIDELLRKLNTLLERQNSISQDIEQIQQEVKSLRVETPGMDIPKAPPKTTEVSPPLPSRLIRNEAGKMDWPEQIDLAGIVSPGLSFTVGNTKTGVKYHRANLVFRGTIYAIYFAENGRWILEDDGGQPVLGGRLDDEGKNFSINKGEHADSVVVGEDVMLNVNVLLDIVPKNKSSKAQKATKKKRGPKKVREKSDIEKFVGQNLITVAGVIVVLIGVIFGVKYSIDHNLVSPTTRIVLSYLLGAGILFTGIRLKSKYEHFSAVLVSGAIAIMYFVTYAGYSLYDLFPQVLAFGLMVFFTLFAVVASLSYNRQVIAHIGLVGSYAVPFLLSDGSGNALVLFSYITIINAGILVLGFKRDWKSLYYSAFGFTWIIFSGWVLTSYSHEDYFNVGVSFALIFFLMFYAIFIAYKLIKKEQFEFLDVLLIILNSTVFYACSYYMLAMDDSTAKYLGLFTAGTALVHFIVSVVMYKMELADRRLFYLTSGMVLAFLTLAIPVQLDGNWVTGLWAFEAALLFWIGRTKDVRIYEFMSYPLMIIAILSIVDDWQEFYRFYSEDIVHISSVFNVMFLTSILVTAAFLFVFRVNRIPEFMEKAKEQLPQVVQVLAVFLFAAVIALLFGTFRLELDLFWFKLYKLSGIEITYDESGYTYMDMNRDYLWLKSVFAAVYTMAFASVLMWVNLKKFKDQKLGLSAIGIGVLGMIFFLTQGLYRLGLLRESYLSDQLDEVHEHGVFNLGARYIGFMVLAILLYSIYKTIHQNLVPIKLKVVFELVLHGAILWCLSSELIHILDLSGSEAQDKLGLSILSGLYAFVLVGLGIIRRKQYLRIAAISLFGLTLLKLFLYDIAHLSTISKTIVFISLGLILLVISFIYNKYKHLIFDEKK